MSRIIAIDYGKKRTGIAVSDTLQMIANGLTTVPTHELLAFIMDYVAKEPVETLREGIAVWSANRPHNCVSTTTHEKQILDSLHRVSKEKENRQ